MITTAERFEISAKEGSQAPRTVLHVLDHSWPILSGYSIRSRNLISAQCRLGERIIVLTSPLHQLDDAGATEMSVDDVQYLRTPLTGFIARAALHRRWPLLREYEIVRALQERILQVISSNSVSLVYAHSPALCGLAALRAARKKKLPFIYEIRAFWEDAAVDQQRTSTRSLRYRCTRALETYVAENADAVSAIATNMLEELQSRGISREKLFHVPNGVDVERISRVPRDESLVSELNLSEGPVLGYFGSLYRYEGVSWMLRAAAVLRSRGHKFHILIIGRGEDRVAIAQTIRDCDASQYVRCIDAVPHEQISRYYSVVDIVVYPRRKVRLTELVTPLKPLEAMALAKPVLASNVGGIRELVDDERTGLLFRPEDEADFFRQAERLLASPGFCQQLGRRGWEFATRERNWAVLAQRYRDLYDFVLRRNMGEMH
jgi:PEP-CTERM/exosortase A-associated glycosyltransferase